LTSLDMVYIPTKDK